jgi:hypothetical protein
MYTMHVSRGYFIHGFCLSFMLRRFQGMCVQGSRILGDSLSSPTINSPSIRTTDIVRFHSLILSLAPFLSIWQQSESKELLEGIEWVTLPYGPHMQLQQYQQFHWSSNFRFRPLLTN